MRRDRLAAARRAIGKSQEQLAEIVQVDRTSIANWERGERSPQPELRVPYAAALGISLNELDELLSDLPPRAGATPIGVNPYFGMEQSATEIRSHVQHVVHGLLQTPEYAAAIARSVGVGRTPDSYVERNVEQRAWRQARVHNGDLKLTAVHSEVPLRLQLGDGATMAAQLDHLVRVGEQPNVTVRVVPFAVGQYEALRIGDFNVLSHPWVQGTSVYYIRHEGNLLVENVDEAANFIAAYEQAAHLALSPRDSLALIAEVAEGWKQR
jgi:transcriptional regulator with XRE-family HTH domain